MLKNITIGQYFPGNSFVHRLDPRTKLLLTVGLIVVVVGQCQPFAGAQQAGEGRMARVAGGGFGAEAGVIADLHVDDVQRHLPSIANTLAVRGPVVGSGLQAVVDVHGAQARMPVAGIGKQMQQHGRIKTAGERYMPGPGIAPGLEGFEKLD